MSFPIPSNMRLATFEDVPAIRRLVNSAYSELAEMGLNFTGSYQDEEVTRSRMRSAEVYLLFRDDELVASINLSIKEIASGSEQCVYIHQLAVRPDQKRRGVGSYLLDFAQGRAEYAQIARLRLDTAIPAKHLVDMYERRGYRVIERVQWEGKTYQSYIMEKLLGSVRDQQCRN